MSETTSEISVPYNGNGTQADSALTSPPLLMRKGLFGNSAPLLHNTEPEQSSQGRSDEGDEMDVPGADDSTEHWGDHSSEKADQGKDFAEYVEDNAGAGTDEVDVPASDDGGNNTSNVEQPSTDAELMDTSDGGERDGCSEASYPTVDLEAASTETLTGSETDREERERAAAIDPVTSNNSMVLNRSNENEEEIGDDDGEEAAEDDEGSSEADEPQPVSLMDELDQAAEAEVAVDEASSPVGAAVTAEEEEGVVEEPEEEDLAHAVDDVQEGGDEAVIPEEEEQASAEEESIEDKGEEDDSGEESSESVKQDAEEPGELDKEEDGDDAIEEEKPVERRTPRSVATPKTPNETVKRGRGRPSKANITPRTPVTDQDNKPKSARGRRGKGNDDNGEDEKTDEAEETADGEVHDEEQEEEHVKETPRRGRRSTTAKAIEDDEDDEEKEPTPTPSRSARGRRSAAAEPTPTAPTRTPRGRGRPPATKEPVEVDEQQDEEEDEAEKKTEEVKKTPGRRGRPKRVSETSEKEKEAKVDDATDEPDNDEATGSRSLRARRSVAATPATPKTPAAKGKTPATKEKRSARRNVAHDDEDAAQSDIEETESEPIRTPRGKAGRRSKGATIATPVRTPGTAKKSAGDDPFDFDDMGDTHPEPLKNIQMEVQSFGEVRFSKVGAGKYSNTEKAAQDRVGALESPPSKPVERRSLMELTKKEVELATQASRSAPARRSKKHDEEENMEVDEPEATPKRRGRPSLGSSATPSTPKSGGTPGRKRRSESSALTPSQKRPKIVAPELSPEDQVAADLPSEGQPGTLPGARVYALYDKVYYPAKVISRDGLGRFQVFFVADALVKELPEASVIPIAELTSGKPAVFENDLELMVAVNIVSPPHPSAWQECIFKVETTPEVEAEDSPRACYERPWDKLLLSMDEWKDYIKDKSAHATDVKTANIETTEDKLKRRSRHSTVAPATPVATTPKQPRRESQAQSSSQKRRAGAEAAAPPAKKSPAKAATAAEAKKAPDFPQIFTKFSFLLTSANRAPGPDQIPFRKNELKLRILERGGHIIETITDNVEGTKPILLSDTYYRTQKYLAAVAFDMPCISHEWLLKCVEEEKWIDYKDYLLQAGLSIVDGKVHERKVICNRLMKGIKVCIYSEQEKSETALTFVEIWEPIAVILGASIKPIEYARGPGVKYFFTDTTCPKVVIDAVRAKGATVLSSEWLIQAIIMGTLPSPDAHPRFAYDCVGSQ